MTTTQEVLDFNVRGWGEFIREGGAHEAQESGILPLVLQRGAELVLREVIDRTTRPISRNEGVRGRVSRSSLAVIYNKIPPQGTDELTVGYHRGQGSSNRYTLFTAALGGSGVVEPRPIVNELRFPISITPEESITIPFNTDQIPTGNQPSVLDKMFGISCVFVAEELLQNPDADANHIIKRAEKSVSLSPEIWFRSY